MNPSTTEQAIPWIGLDIGGANIKAAHGDGTARSVPFEVWKRPDELAVAIGTIVSGLPPAAAAAITMTAELCDCYPSRRVGVLSILDAASRALSDRPFLIWGVDGSFHRAEAIRARPLLAAAANWLALAVLAARLVPDRPALMIDIGTTTTDLIPLGRGTVAARGRTDTERLQTGELVYAGTRRTPIHALGTMLPVRGVPTGLAAELFASTLDVYLLLGDIPPNPTDLSTADGRPATVVAARDRLARMVGADHESFSMHEAREFARAADHALTSRLIDSARRVCLSTIGQARAAIVAGSGEFLAARVAAAILPPGSPIISLEQAWGSIASAAGCAYALVRLAAERIEVDPPSPGPSWAPPFSSEVPQCPRIP